MSTKQTPLLKLDIAKISAQFYSEADHNKVTREVVEKTVAPNQTSQIKQEPKIPTKPLVEKIESEQEADEIKVNKAQAPKMIPTSVQNGLNNLSKKQSPKE